jgi:soluble cytochrome b562
MEVDKNLIQGALAFIERATLQASEVEAFTAVKSHLIDLLHAEPEPRVKVVKDEPDMKLK